MNFARTNNFQKKTRLSRVKGRNSSLRARKKDREQLEQLNQSQVQAQLELYGGSIRTESSGKGKGATFTIELPLAKETQASRPKAPTVKLPTTTRPSGKGMSILLVEDHEPTRVSLMHLLLRRHYKVVPAGTLSEARDLLGKEKFHLLISDIGLPDGNGCDLMEGMQKGSRMKGIALTGYGMEQDIARSREAGFIVHLTKPVHIESLDNALMMAMKGRYKEGKSDTCIGTAF